MGEWVAGCVVLPPPTPLTSIQRSLRVSSAPPLTYPLFRMEACCKMTRDLPFHRRVNYSSSTAFENCALPLLSTHCSGCTSFTAGYGVHATEFASFFCFRSSLPVVQDRPLSPQDQVFIQRSLRSAFKGKISTQRSL